MDAFHRHPAVGWAATSLLVVAFVAACNGGGSARPVVTATAPTGSNVIAPLLSSPAPSPSVTAIPLAALLSDLQAAALALQYAERGGRSGMLKAEPVQINGKVMAYGDATLLTTGQPLMPPTVIGREADKAVWLVILRGTVAVRGAAPSLSGGPTLAPITYQQMSVVFNAITGELMELSLYAPGHEVPIGTLPALPMPTGSEVLPTPPIPNDLPDPTSTAARPIATATAAGGGVPSLSASSSPPASAGTFGPSYLTALASTPGATIIVSRTSPFLLGIVVDQSLRVIDLDLRSRARAAGIERGDMLVAIGATAVTTPQDAKQILRTMGATSGQGDSFTVTIRRNGQAMMITVGAAGQGVNTPVPGQPLATATGIPPDRGLDYL